MSQFAIITNEGWTETMYETMRAVGENESLHFYTYFMPIYFIFSHMFCSLVKTKHKKRASLNLLTYLTQK